MRRPSKRKVEEAETTAEDGAEIDGDTGVTGAQQPALDDSTQAAATKDPTAGPGHRKWKAALAAFEEAVY